MEEGKDGFIPKPIDDMPGAVVFAAELLPPGMGSAMFITILGAVGGEEFVVNPGTSPSDPMLPIPGIAISNPSSPFTFPSKSVRLFDTGW